MNAVLWPDKQQRQAGQWVKQLEFIEDGVKWFLGDFLLHMAVLRHLHEYRYFVYSLHAQGILGRPGCTGPFEEA